MNQDKRDSLRGVGGFLVITGLVFVSYGIYELFMVTPCPALPYHCPSNSIYWGALYAGLASVAVGAGMIMVSLRDNAVRLNRSLIVGLVLIILVYAVFLSSGIIFAPFAWLILLIGVVFLFYGTWKSPEAKAVSK